MSERHNAVQSIEYDRRIYHFVVVKLSKVLCFRCSALIELEIILLETEGNLLQYVIDDSDGEVLVVTIQGSKKNGK